MAGENDSAPDTPAAVASIADSILGQLPDVQEHAVAQAQAEASGDGGESGSGGVSSDAGSVSGVSNESAATDASGTKFDPAIHSADGAGKGILNASGVWRKKRKSKVASGAKAATAPALAPGEAPPMTEQQKAQARMAGVAAAHATFMAGRMFGGDEWIPIVRQVDTADGKKASMDERAMIEGAYGDYFIATNKADFPPGVALFMALAMYATPRFTMPVTKSRIQAIKEWAARKWLNWKHKRAVKKGEAAEKGADVQGESTRRKHD